MKNILNSLIIILMTAYLISCTSYSRSDLKGISSDQSDIYKILYYASLAGSSHNSQPWKAEVYSEDSILIFADKSKQLRVVDPSSRELYMSVGAFIENFNLAAQCFGYESDIKINDLSGDSCSHVATIILIRSKPEKVIASLKDIELRTTLRIPFDTTEINKDDWRKLVSNDTVNIHYLPSNSEKGRYLKQKELEAYTEQAKRENAQDELATWIRFSNKDVRQKNDGLTTAGMGINGIGGFVVRNFFKPTDSKKESFVTQGIDKTRIQADNCGGWIVITQPAENIENWINTGRLYQRMNIQCRNLKIGFHPMNQIIEENNYELSAGKFLGFDGKLEFIARIGYVNNYPAPVSVRRPVESFTTFR
ncbi:MAG: hypothetical protein RBT02_05765 [Bacteroidales bacterium]|nr:hypothetical protein [Bacteroidales bacterium]